MVGWAREKLGIADAKQWPGMSPKQCKSPTGAFTLFELLCVILIIGLLAALLLPALAKVRARARQVQCVNQLRQVGIGFQNFAHDHNSQFPMAVPVSAGGSLEFVRSAEQSQGEFYFGFRHFQVLSNELVNPHILVCPADTRQPASAFPALKNENVSYFVATKAVPARPSSILSGDRNVTNDYGPRGTMRYLGPNASLRWTEELHRFKGNLLFADGHVEEKPTAVLVATAGTEQGSAAAELVFPSVPAPPSAPAPLVRERGSVPVNLSGPATVEIAREAPFRAPLERVENGPPWMPLRKEPAPRTTPQTASEPLKGAGVRNSSSMSSPSVPNTTTNTGPTLIPDPGVVSLSPIAANAPSLHPPDRDNWWAYALLSFLVALLLAIVLRFRLGRARF